MVTASASIPLEQEDRREIAALELLRLCQSRLASLRQLVQWNADFASRPADALILAEALARDLFAIVAGRVAGEDDRPGLADMKDALAGGTSPAAVNLRACVMLLQRPWADWKPDQQIQLMEQIGPKLRAAVEDLVEKTGERPEAQVPRRRYGRFAVAAIGLAVLVGAVHWAYAALVVPPLYQRRVSDLAELRTALERYRTAHGQYPRSAQNGAVWNGIGWNGSAADWIPGLAPDFIAKLPRDPRGTENPYQQYVYRSDGKNYKLIVLVSEDCQFVIDKYPEMADETRNVSPLNDAVRQCNAYGIWTPGALGW